MFKKWTLGLVLKNGPGFLAVPGKLFYNFCLITGRTHVRIKGQNLNIYLETHATPHNLSLIHI